MKRFVMLWTLTHALAGCATERLYVKVLDGEGNPVTNGIVRVGFSTSHVLFGGGNSTTRKSGHAEGRTDKDGNAVVKFNCKSSDFGWHVEANGLIVASNYLYRAEMLAYAIPSESYAVGANPLPTLSAKDLNFNMADFTDGQSDLPENGQEMEDKHRNWQHSTFVQRTYKRTHQLFDQLISFIKENSHE